MVDSNRELDSFLSKFKYLSSVGFKAAISFKSENFVTRVSLEVELPFVLPPWNLPPPSNVASSPKSPRHRSLRDERSRSEEIVVDTMDTSKVVSGDIDEVAILPKIEDCESSKVVEDSAPGNCNFEASNDSEHELQTKLADTEDINEEERIVVSVAEQETTVQETEDIPAICQDETTGNEDEIVQIADGAPNNVNGGDPYLRPVYIGHYPMPKLEFLKL